MRPKELYELLLAFVAKIQMLATWACMHSWRRLGTFALVIVICTGSYSIRLKYLEYQVSQANTVQLNELRWQDLENRAGQTIDAVNLCISTPREDEKRAWYCEEALNNFKAELPAVISERTTKIIQQEAYPLMILEMKAGLRRVAYERLIYAKPPEEETMLKQLLKWSWPVMAAIILAGFAWFAYLHRQLQRIKASENSLPHLEV